MPRTRASRSIEDAEDDLALISAINECLWIIIQFAKLIPRIHSEIFLAQEHLNALRQNALRRRQVIARQKATPRIRHRRKQEWH